MVRHNLNLRSNLKCISLISVLLLFTGYLTIFSQLRKLYSVDFDNNYHVFNDIEPRVRSCPPPQTVTPLLLDGNSPAKRKAPRVVGRSNSVSPLQICRNAN
jgi:hypothetical protein